MKKPSQILWKASATVPADQEEPLVELLTNCFGGSVTSYTNLETGLATISVFLQKRSEWAPGLAETLDQRSLLGGPAHFPKFRLTRLRRQDWAESWKEHFKPIRIGKVLEVRPPWVKTPASPGCKVVVLEPGLSFGTGHHPTTAFCLGEIARLRGHGTSFLDAGTGSGILAIAAVKLGWKRIEAFDFDADAIRIAKANATRNRVLPKVRFKVADVTVLPMKGLKYDLICANLISTLLIEQRDRLIARLADGGSVVLAGILKTEFERVKSHYEQAGLSLTKSRALKEWRSGTFARRS